MTEAPRVNNGDGTGKTTTDLGGLPVSSLTDLFVPMPEEWDVFIEDHTGDEIKSSGDNPFLLEKGVYTDFIFSAYPTHLGKKSLAVSPAPLPPCNFEITFNRIDENGNVLESVFSEMIYVEVPNQETIIRGHQFDDFGDYEINLKVTPKGAPRSEQRRATLNTRVPDLQVDPRLAVVITHPSCHPTNFCLENDTLELTVGFTGVPSLGQAPYTYNWNFGDSSTETVADVSLVDWDHTIIHHYDVPGEYTVILTVIDDNLIEATDEVTFTVAGPGPPQDEGDWWGADFSPRKPREVLHWLARRRALKGIPFQYLVPTEDALPPETIRFFHIDRNWIDALIDGCLSVALTTTRERKWLLEKIEDPIWAEKEDRKPLPWKAGGLNFEHLDINSDGLLNKSDYIAWATPKPGSYLVDGAGQTGASLIIDTGTLVMYKGQTLTIEGDTETYTVEKIVHAVGVGFTSLFGTTVTEITLTPELVKTPEDDALITLEGDDVDLDPRRRGLDPAYPDDIPKIKNKILIRLKKIIEGKEPLPDHRPCNDIITNYENILRGLNSLETRHRGKYYNSLLRKEWGEGVEIKEGGRLTGMLFRSTIVRDFPGMEISAYKGLHWGPGNLIQIIRIERLSESIMLCIFNGIPTHLRIQEPSEGIRMGVDIDSQGTSSSPYTYKLKLKDGDGALLDGGLSVSVPARLLDPILSNLSPAAPDNEILDIKSLYENLLASDAAPKSVHPPQPPQKVGFPLDSVGAFIAAQMLQFPYQQDFVRLPDVHPDHPDINFPGKA